MRNLWMILILYVLVVACEELVPVEPNPPVVEVKIPKVEMTITPSGVLPYGAKCTLNVNSDSKNVTLNNKSVEVPNSMEFQLFENTTYTLSATNGYQSNSIEKVVTVGDWTTSKIGLVTYKPWMLKSLKYIQNGEVVANLALSNEQLTDLYYFSIKGEATWFHANGQQFGGCDWSFFEDSCIVIGPKYMIVSLNKNEFIVRIESDYYNKPAIFEKTYYRP